MQPHLSQGLLEGFRKIDASIKERIADLQTPLQKGFAALQLARDILSVEYLSISDICLALEGADTYVAPSSLKKAFARAGDRVSKKDIGGVPSFKIMVKGRRDIEPFIRVGNIEVIHIESGKPRTAHQELDKLLSSLSGNIRICDRYFGERSIDALEMIPPSCSVKLLTETVTDDVGKLRRRIADLKREGRLIDIMTISGKGDMHDRYIMSQCFYYLLGAGLKDIGTRESFIVVLHRDYVNDLINHLENSFDGKFKSAVPL